MKTVILTPFGCASQETGLIYLIVNYLSQVHKEIVQLRCNGIFSLCERDFLTEWQRSFSACSECLAEQIRLAEWASIGVLDLSQYLTAEEAVNSKRWLASIDASNLERSRYKGINIYQLCRESVEKRLGISDTTAHNKFHELTLRRLMLSAVRMLMATKRFNNQFHPDLALVAGGNDLITRSFVEQSQEQKKEVAVFSWNLGGHSITITHLRTGRTFSCDLVLEGIAEIRKDFRSWPPEFLDIIDQVLAFLNIPASQLSLPLAR